MSGPPPVDVFCYGTLVFADVLEAVAGRTFPSVAATLEGFVRRQVRGAVYPGVIAYPGESVAGLVWLGVDAGALARLDAFEGDLYERREVQVLRADACRGPAHAWIVPPHRAHLLAPEGWDPQVFRERHHARYLARCRAMPERARRG